MPRTVLEYACSNPSCGKPFLRPKRQQSKAHHAPYCCRKCFITHDRDPAVRFWKFVDKRANGCWLWTGSSLAGYGRFSYYLRNEVGLVIGKVTKPAHAFAYELKHGPVQPGLQMLHSCDTPLCVNPSHLSPGTPQDNMKDRNQKGRQARGSRNAKAKLRESDIPLIRSSSDDALELAARYGVSRRTIYAIRGGDVWEHV